MKKSSAPATIEVEDRDDLPEGWESCGMADISELVTSGSRDWSKFYSNNGAYFVRSAEINDYNLRISEAIRVALPAKIEGKRSLIEKDDILVTITGANVGKCARVDSVIPEAYVSQSVALIKLKQEKLAPFVYYAMRAPNFAGRQLTDMAYGMGRPVLSLPQIKSLRIPLAPLVEQERILEQIEALLSRVGTTNQRLAKVPAILKAFRRSVLVAACSGRLTEDWRVKHPDVETGTSVLHEMLENRQRSFRRDAQKADAVALPELPSTWCAASVDQLLCEPLTNGRSVVDREGGFPVLRLTALKNGRIDLAERKAGAWTLAQARPFLVKKGDFLVSRGNGSLRLVGRGGLVSIEPDPVAYPDTLIRVRLNKGLDAGFLAYVWDSQLIRDQVEARAHTTAGIHKISQQDIALLTLPVPPQLEQHEIVRRADALFKLADRIEERVKAGTKQADKLTQSILAKAFRGELVPTEAELARKEHRPYEPASALLARIKTERETVLLGNGTPRRGISRKK